MNKWLQLADDIELDLKELDNDADELQSRRRANKERARGVVNDHHKIQDRVEDGLRRMEQVVEAAGLPNSRKFTQAELDAIAAEEAKQKEAAAKLGEGSGDTSTTAVPVAADGEEAPAVEPEAPFQKPGA